MAIPCPGVLLSDDLLHTPGHRHRGDTSVVLRLDGDLDLGSAADTRARLEAAAADGCRELVVDLAAVRFCDVVGVNVLLRARAQLAARGATLRLRGTDERLRALLDGLGVTHLLPVE
jgi:anti-anti-sigma factor